MTPSDTLFDRSLLASRRGRAASQIANHDFLLRRVADDLADRVEAVVRDFPLVLDLGSHHGCLARRLAPLPNIGRIICADASPGMLALTPGRGVVCDEDFLPFASGTFDLVVSALSLQWVNDLPGALLQVRQSLKPDGLFLGAVLGGETLKELADAFMASEVEVVGGASPRVGPFADVRSLGTLLQRAGMALPVADADRLTVNYETPFALMNDLKAMGATNVLADRSRVPLRRSTLMRMAQIYVERHADNRGRVPATFDIVTLTGWAPDDSQPKPLRPGAATTRLADVLGAREQSTGDKADPGRKP